jgi:choline dehydrogenase-like flavoprotein
VRSLEQGERRRSLPKTVASSQQDFDVCVVGTGAGGGVMIQELCEAGFRVVALQRGPLLGPSDFINNDEYEVVVRDTLFSPHQVETWRPDESTPAVKGRFNMVAECVGGTMTHWAAWSWRFRPDDFEVLSREGPVAGANLADWPFSYVDLAPWYDKAERDFGVAGDAKANPFGAPRTTSYVLPPHPPRTSGRIFARGAKALGYTPFPVPLAINSREYGGRSACMYGGACQQYGCPVHAKATTLSVCIPRARATGKLDLRPESVAAEITVGPDGRARSVRYLDAQRREQEVTARWIVVAGNAMGTPHLLLSSKSAKFPDGLANSSGQVGRNLTYHHAAFTAYLAKEPTSAYMGVESHCAIDDLHASDPKRGFIRGGVIADMNMSCKQPIMYATLHNAGREATRRGWGTGYKSYLRDFPRAGGIVSILEDLPMESNRIDLDPDVKDAYGLPAPRITHRQHANDVAMNRWYAERQLEIADSAGVAEKWTISKFAVSDTNPTAGSPHFHGTCRMGRDASRSVVDPWCRAHDVPNLFVVDGSVFPTSGGYNPTLTILATAYRAADHFIAAAKRMEI